MPIKEESGDLQLFTRIRKVQTGGDSLSPNPTFTTENACLQTNYSKYDPFSNTTVTIIAVRRVVRSSPVADGPLGQRIKAAAQQAADL
ncbi:hypothetical protein T05_13850 [Trichinella murrelli]|uniref:Uncharacterized protein n=1 Tax=Trichinella murrelli TaxID=144512 RepID=A0A0V0T083_9BILA|nr:hypothetical protein T05_13850 [Trichinella murrelli]